MKYLLCKLLSVATTFAFIENMSRFPHRFSDSMNRTCVSYSAPCSACSHPEISLVVDLDRQNYYYYSMKCFSHPNFILFERSITKQHWKIKTMLFNFFCCQSIYTNGTPSFLYESRQNIFHAADQNRVELTFRLYLFMQYCNIMNMYTHTQNEC